jgi:hypothetical protein
MTLRQARRLLTVLPVAIAWLGASTAWCFCAPPAFSASPAHGCCEDGVGLVPGGDCCHGAASGQARDVVVPGGGSPAPAIAASVAPALAVGLAPPPSYPRAVPPPAVVLRV